jgi:lysophospholipase L1-like esterase
VVTRNAASGRQPVALSSPAALSGLAGWWKASTGLFQDTGFVTPAAANNDPVGGWRDQSGNGRDVTQATAGVRPTLAKARFNGLDAVLFNFANSQFLSYAGASGLGGGAGSTYFVVTDATPGNAGFTFSAGGPAGGFDPTTLGVFGDLPGVSANTTDGIRLWYGSGSRHVSKADLSRQARLYVVRYDGGQSIPYNRLQMWRNGARVRLVPEIGTIPATMPASTGVWAGRDQGGGSFLNGSVFEHGYYARALSDGEVAALSGYLKAAYFGGLGNQISCNGDSLIFGSNSSWQRAKDPPSQLVALLGPGWAATQNGVVARTTTNLLTQQTLEVERFRQENRAREICWLWAGTNDLYAAATPASALANIATYCRVRKDFGWKVVVTTCLPRNDAGVSGTFEADRQALNTLLRATWRGYADALCDVGADAAIGVAAAYNNATYYDPDKCHMTDAGYAVVAGLAQAAVLAL